MEVFLWQIEGIASSCTLHTPEQLRLPFHTAKCSQSTIAHEEYGWALQESSQCQVQPSDQIYQENPTHPAGSPLSTQPAWWATNTGLDEQSCKCTWATVALMHVYLTWPIGEQDGEQTQSCLASEGWCPIIHYPSNSLHKPVHHWTVRVQTKYIPACTYLYSVHTNIYMHNMDYYHRVPVPPGHP